MHSNYQLERWSKEITPNKTPASLSEDTTIGGLTVDFQNSGKSVTCGITDFPECGRIPGIEVEQ